MLARPLVPSLALFTVSLAAATPALAQSIADTGGGGNNIVPSGWRSVSGSCDGATNAYWESSGAGDLSWTARLTTPSSGQDDYMTCYGAERASTTITGLTSGTEYEIRIDVANHDVSYRSGTYGGAGTWSYRLTNASGISVSPTSATAFNSGFREYTLTFTASKSSATLTLGTEDHDTGGTMTTVGDPKKSEPLITWAIGSDAVTVACTVRTWYADEDDDGFGDASVAVSACDNPGGYVLVDGDCDDDDPGVNPGADETIDSGVDEDCDDVELCYVDADDDGYRPGDGSDTVASTTNLNCTDSGEAQSTDDIGDCDDADALTYPGADEIVADGKDQDCDGEEICYEELDGDDFRTDIEQVSTDADCLDEGEALATVTDGDCDDADPLTYPGAREVVADNKDQDCGRPGDLLHRRRRGLLADSTRP